MQLEPEPAVVAGAAWRILEDVILLERPPVTDVASRQKLFFREETITTSPAW
jgi:hypothetical protein